MARSTETTIRGRASRLIHNAIHNSKKRGHPAPDLTPDDLIPALERGVCQVTGVQFVLTPCNPPHPLSPSLDRPDSSRPYSRENFRLVAWAVNTGCGHWGHEVYMALAARALGVSNPSTDAVLARLQETP